MTLSFAKSTRSCSSAYLTEAKTVKDGKEAVDLCRSGENFDIIFMDKEMPIMDGHEATKHLSAMGVKSIIVGITTRADGKDKEEFLASGSNHCFEKPLDQAKELAMAVPVEEAIAALSTFSLEDEQPEVQGPGVWVSTERGATESPIEYSDVSAYRLSLSEDTKALNQLNALTQEGKEMASVLYTYRSCVKALPQLPDSMKQSQADLYLETYQVLDLEMSRLREIQRWQASASSKVQDLAADMQRFSRPERRINGPTISHLWSMLKLLDVLVQLDHLKNAKASIPNDFSWYKRTFTQVSGQWQDTDSMREELDDLQSLELDFALLFPERHILLRVLPVLVVLVTSSEKDSESLYKRVKINRLINIFKNEAVIPAFPDLHLSPAAILKELSTYFPKFSSQTRLLTLPAPHELPPREAQEYPPNCFIHYLIINHIGAIRAEHDDFVIRFASAMNQLLLLKSTDGSDVEWSKEVKGNMYDMIVEGFQLLSRWTARIWEQCAWKFSRPCKDASPSFSDYEKVVRYNYSAEERKALVELVSYIKSVGSMMQRCDTLVADALWETIHSEVQDFVQNTLATMLRTTFRKKKDLSRILSDMRTLSADWMANTNKSESELQSSQHGGEESKANIFYPRAVAPTAAQVHCLQFLIYEVVSGGNLRRPGGLFGNSGSEIPVNDLKQLETFFYKLGFFLHILDYSAQQALVLLKQRFLYDEIEAEVDHCFDIFVTKLCETIFTYYKSWAASELLDPSFLFASDNAEKYAVQPIRLNMLLKITRVKLLGRMINLRSLITEWMNKVFRENIEFLFGRFECQDLCAIVELEKLLDVLKHSHELLSRDLSVDSFSLMLNEMQENISLVSFSSRLASQIWSEMQSDFLPNFILCNTTQRFIRSSRTVPVQKPSVPSVKPSFYCGTQDLNSAHQSFARLHSGFFGIPHMFSVVRLLGSRSLPWLIRALLDHISNKITLLEPMITGLQDSLPKSIGLLPFDGGVTGCVRLVKEHLNWETKSELKAEVLHGIKEIGSVLYWMGLLDIVLREKDSMDFMQTAPWLGLLPGADGQIATSQDGGDSPVVSLFKSTAAAMVSYPGCPSPTSFHIMSKQAEAADLLYKANLNTGSVLEYALAFTSAALDKYCNKWSAAPKTGFIDITISKDFYRIYSGLQIGYLEESAQVPSNSHERLGDSVAWGGCTIIYLLGQQLHFELFDFSYQILNIAEVEAASVMQTHKNSQFSVKGWEALLEAMKKARRLNNHVFSMLKARCPLEEKTACAIKQSGAPIHRIKFDNTVSAFETLPQKDTKYVMFHEPSFYSEEKLRELVKAIVDSDDYSLQAADEAIATLSSLKHLKSPDDFPLPPQFRCPISTQLMSDPVILSTGQLSVPDQKEAAKELRLLTKRMPSIRTLVGESSDVIPQLLSPLSSPGAASTDPDLHEDLITTILNLSIHDDNKKVFATDPAVISLLIDALKCGTIQTRSNAAATIFTLSAIDSNKHIIGESGAIKHLLELLDEGQPFAMKDAASAIFNLCLVHENKGRTVRDGAVRVILNKMMDHILVDELLAILALLSSHPKAVEEMGDFDAVPLLLGIIRESTSERSKENCVAILYTICFSDRTKLKEIREEEKANGTLSKLAKCGTSRAKRKANGILERLNRSPSLTHTA
ncbi:hypothetical protein JHK85_008743 [Glycine max]|nr:hypothetical protein JHK85_008743 [Glycine max]